MSVKTPKKTNSTKLNVSLLRISVRVGSFCTKVTLQPALQTVLADQLMLSKYVDTKHEAKLAAKTALGRFTANTILEQEILKKSSRPKCSQKKQYSRSHYVSNSLMSELFHKSLIEGYVTSDKFTEHRCQLPHKVLKGDGVGDDKMGLYSAIVYAFDTLAKMLNVKRKDIINYFVWLYVIHFTSEKTGKLVKKGKDKSCNYRDLVILTFYKNSFNLEDFKTNFKIFWDIRSSNLAQLKAMSK